MTYSEQNKTTIYPPEIKRLLNMLTYKRPAWSESEEEFISKFIRPLKDKFESFMEDSFGNIYVQVGRKNAETLFCCHTDAVHRTSGTQLIVYDQFTMLAYKSTDQPDGECLGADDAAGVALLLEMIDHGVNGWYAFFRCEERGGKGSDYAAKNEAPFLKSFKRAIAFDRKGNSSVITHQGWGRCCSDTFANALADALNQHTGTTVWQPDDTGIFTDTANFTELIPECTNVSVFYEDEHTVNECLDLEGWMRLRKACLTIDWNSLPTERDPSVKEDYSSRYTFSFNGRFASSIGVSDEVDKLRGMRFKQMVEWVKKSSPESVGEVLYEMIDQIMTLEEKNADLQQELDYNYTMNDVPPHAYDDYMEDDDDRHFDA